MAIEEEEADERPVRWRDEEESSDEEEELDDEVSILKIIFKQKNLTRDC